MNLNTIYNESNLETMARMPDNFLHCVVTSPPYWGLRDYGTDGTPWPAVSYRPMPGMPEIHIPEQVAQLGLEETPEAFVGHIVHIFREVRRVLREDGTLWLNFGDSYAGSQQTGGVNSISGNGKPNPHGGILKKSDSLKPKDLCGIPWRVAFALQADGWWLRQDVIWAKPNPMPESVTDRCTKAHEYIFLLTKSSRYYYDAEAVKEMVKNNTSVKFNGSNGYGGKDRRDGLNKNKDVIQKRNRRSVWTIATQPYSSGSKTDRWKHVEEGVLSDGMMHIMSPNCPIYGGLFDLLASVLCGEHEDFLLNGTGNIGDYLSLEPSPGFVSIDQLSFLRIGVQSLGSFLLKRFQIARPHSNRIHKKGLFLSTSLSCKPSEERTARIERILTEHGFGGHHLDMILNKTSELDFDDNQKPQIPYCIVDTDRVQDFSSACGLNFEQYTKIIDHFAVFPPALVKPCILAGSPQKVCSECGAGYVREVEKVKSFESGSGKSGNVINGKNGAKLQGGGTTGDIRKGPTVKTKTIGWLPACTCNTETGRAIVYDPFGGSGTTAEVANEYGRNWIVSEISEEYVRECTQPRLEKTKQKTLF